MKEVIKKVFGTSIGEERFSFPSHIPNYIRYGYKISRLFFGDKGCLLVEPKDGLLNLGTLKKQVKKIEALTGEPVVAQLNRLTSAQRTNLIESGIAFVSGTGQIFIPFWGCYFEEKISSQPVAVDKLSANAQFVFLSLYYNHAEDTMTQTDIAETLGLAKSTCSRAIQQLSGLEIISLAGDGAANRISMGNRAEALSKALPHMVQPVHKRIYVRQIPDIIQTKLSGVKALAHMSMLAMLDTDAGFAVSRAMTQAIKEKDMIDEQTYKDFGGEVIEIWKYDPYLLPEEDRVDDISLYLELKDDPDERIQIELDIIREKYCIKGDDR